MKCKHNKCLWFNIYLYSKNKKAIYVRLNKEFNELTDYVEFILYLGHSNPPSINTKSENSMGLGYCDNTSALLNHRPQKNIHNASQCCIL